MLFLSCIWLIHTLSVYKGIYHSGDRLRLFLFTISHKYIKDKGHPITGHEGPEGGVKV